MVTFQKPFRGTDRAACPTTVPKRYGQEDLSRYVQMPAKDAVTSAVRGPVGTERLSPTARMADLYC